jgi:hypothetical protein
MAVKWITTAGGFRVKLNSKGNKMSTKISKQSYDRKVANHDRLNKAVEHHISDCRCNKCEKRGTNAFYIRENFQHRGN